MFPGGSWIGGLHILAQFSTLPPHSLAVPGHDPSEDVEPAGMDRPAPAVDAAGGV